jgi:hypothetical protein
MSGMITLAMTFLMVESYAPKLLEDKAKRLSQPGRVWVSHLDLQITKKELFKRSIIRPTKVCLRVYDGYRQMSPEFY